MNPDVKPTVGQGQGALRQAFEQVQLLHLF